MKQPIRTLGEAFTTRVLDAYDRARSPLAKEQGALEHRDAAGHPQTQSLGVGQQATLSVATLYLDLTNFTGRTFWDSQKEVTDLAHAVLSGFTYVVTQFGGHVVGLRGDGLVAVFGPAQAEVSVAAAAGAAATALNLVRENLNPELQSMGIAPVQARAGADYGDVTFIRSGTAEVNEVNAIGFSINFAAKCEKYANSWEFVVGQRFSEEVQSTSMLAHHPLSPKRYSRGDDVRQYRFYDYKWRKTVSIAADTVEELDGRYLEDVFGVTR